MTTYQIPEEATFEGAWFLPGTEPPQEISGTLSWSPTLASLDLHDSFVPLRSGPLFQSASQVYPAIHGTTTDSKLISVLDASWSRGSMTFGQAGTRRPESFTSNLVVVGAHVDPQTLYTEMRVRIPGLQIWLGKGGIEQEIIHKTDHSAAGMILRVSGVNEESIEIPAIAATLGWGIDRRFSGDPLTNLSITSSGHLRIFPDQPQNVDWFLNQLAKATTLLAFVAGSPMTADEVAAKATESAANVNVLMAWSDPKYCAYHSSHEFYLLRGSMEADLGVVFQKWYTLYDTVEMPSQLALSVLSSEGSWLHVAFLSLMQALEGFHRAVAVGTYMPAEDYEAVEHVLTVAIPVAVDSSHRDALKSRIKYGNEISLRKRLNELASRLDLSLRKRILGGKGTVPPKWVATRNYYTHWDAASRGEALKGVEMYYATVRMRHFLRALYLDFVGIPQTAIAKALESGNKESQHLIQLNQD